jgi:hypothetical protein
MELKIPHTSMTVRRVYVKDKKTIDSEIQEGEVPMSQEQQDQYKAIIGDGLARVSVGRDLSESDFGSGCKAFVSVSLACDQSAAAINYAVGLADQMATYYVERHLQEARQRCYALQLLKPPVDPNARPQY